MGSYNVACSVSNISIGPGERIAYFPLRPNQYAKGFEGGPADGNNTLIHTNCYYYPVTLPIFGTYDDYGGIENIEKNLNTYILEKYFGQVIEVIANIHRGEGIPKITSGMFVHRDIFDTLVNKCAKVDEFGRKHILMYNSSEKNIDKELSREFDEFAASIRKAKEREAEFSSQLKEKTRLGWEIWIENWKIFNFRDYPVFRDIYLPHIENGDLKQQLIQFVKFETGLFATNNFYFPAMNGYQCGNVYASRYLYQKAYKMMRNEVYSRRWRNFFKDPIDMFIWRNKRRLKKLIGKG